MQVTFHKINRAEIFTVHNLDLSEIKLKTEVTSDKLLESFEAISIFKSNSKMLSNADKHLFFIHLGFPCLAKITTLT